ncbi:MAG: Gldg family protein [Pseudomonadota bacterium]|jgi:ABC-2 type transport system permease protein
MADTLRIARKEFRGFFTTPAAYLFLGAFAAATLFIFFWVETFFARNIADLRPLFEWLPLLLIFLVAALTMRSWSEERRSGTLETLLTAPVRPLHLVLGKFLGALGLVAVALALTLPLTLTVALLGPLDWGPVIGGYVATLFLAAAYVAIGLYMSGRTDNPIVALILTTLVCGIFYLVGSGTLTNLFGHRIGGVLALLGTGTRFESITRGVLDLRDLYYYVSIVGVFLALNRFGLERLRWAGNPTSGDHRLWALAVGLTIANFVAANLWLAPIGWARADITQERLYSLSAATRAELARASEPLLIRGYFSAKTHPLLAPLVPRIQDLLREYAVAGGDRIHVEFVDPHVDRELEEEAAARYGIKPVPFQTASRYQAAVVNSYFDVLVSYGDQFETLSFEDLIEVKSRGGDRELDVLLKNPEYAITRAIRKVIDGYRAGGNPFESLTEPVRFHGYFSPDAKLPAELVELRRNLAAALDDYRKQAGDRLQVEYADPEAGQGELAKTLGERYGFRPQIASLLDPQPFWFYMVIESGSDSVQVPLPETLDEGTLKRTLDAAFQRLAPGFLKTVALVKPSAPYGAGPSYEHLIRVLEENVRVQVTELDGGRVPEDADLLLALAPQDLDERQLFAIDQFLMRGGSLVLATSPFAVQLDQTLAARRQRSGLEDWLAGMGLTIEDTMVLDPRNAALPVPVERYIGGIAVQEIRMLPYPHFPDLRGDGLDPDNPITASLDQLTLNWASPIRIDDGKLEGRNLVRLLQSSPQSWRSADLNLIPDYGAFPGTGFAEPEQRGRETLAVAVEGRFTSFFRGKEPPQPKDADAAKAPEGGETRPVGDIRGVIERSPESARLVLVASGSFASDTAIELASQGLGTLYLRPVEFLQNAIDWALEDRNLLALRGRSQLARTLEPLGEAEQRRWEYLNYGLALLGLIAVWGWRTGVAAADRRRYRQLLAEV